ncbi:MAG TPA: methylated-DNA--[protein]-cysteine S-methyltransferase [Kofleriaceae bacterium]|nr:methylated-DNA--[protein]-cysteine S-methyltransferase [Kofleriaceae bacterium]
MADATPQAPGAGFAVFPTAIGACGIAWSARGVVTRILLPDADPARTRAALSRGGLGEADPPPAIAAAIARLTQHVAGAPADLSAIELDMTGVPDFHREVYAEARRIPCGRTVSYGALATALGKPGAARAVGQAMGKNPFPIVVPCHRVLAANHASGGFSAPLGLTTKAQLLAAEGVAFALQPELPFGAPGAPARRRS